MRLQSAFLTFCNLTGFRLGLVRLCKNSSLPRFTVLQLLCSWFSDCSDKSVTFLFYWGASHNDLTSLLPVTNLQQEFNHDISIT